MLVSGGYKPMAIWGIFSFTVLLTTLTLLLGVAIVVAFRRVCDFPTELDRIGSDLSLYGYGVGLSFLFGTQTGKPVLSWLKPPERVTLLISVAILITLLFYCINMFLSRRMRAINRFQYRDGIETFDDLMEMLGERRGLQLFAFSIACGLLPTATLVVMDLAE
jgi:hypothetical protein